MSLLSTSLIFVLAVAVRVATEVDTPQKVCVFDKEQQDLACIHCDTATCIVKNDNDSTHIQFVSPTFDLKNALHIRNRENIFLEGIPTRIECKEQSEIGLYFNNIKNLTIVSITINNCGMVWHEHFLTLHHLQSAIFLIHCTHVYISGVRILQSVGSGLAIIECNGTVTVEESLFENNGIGNSEHKVAAGGLILCSGSCSSDAQNSGYKWSKNTTYALTDCNFISNYAGMPEVGGSSDEKRLLGRGGGLAIIMLDGVDENRITLTRCQFLNNTATWGGGMHVWFRNSSENTILVVQNSYFERNLCPKRAGGAVNIVNDKKKNHVTFANTSFVENSAGVGGGVGIFSSQRKILLHFNGCSWTQNKAHLSSAMDVFFKTSEAFQYGKSNQVTLSDCVFTNNKVLHVPLLYNQTNTSEQYTEGKGALVVTAHSIQFEGTTTFTGNNGTALYLVTSNAMFAPSSTVLFEGNSGLQGGAVALIGLSAIKVQQCSNFTFRKNYAYTSGGAIYYYSVDQHEYFTGSSNCFIQSLNKKNVHFTFDGNQAGERYGRDIQATTLNHCRRMCNVVQSNDPVEIFKCIGQFNFSNKRASVSTSGGQFFVNARNKTLLVIPGKEFSIPFKARDDLNSVSKGYYSIRVKNFNGSSIVVDPAYTLIANEHMKLYGQPEEKAQLVVTKVGTRPITLIVTVEISYCPPGFDIQNITTPNKKHPGPMCVCSYDYEGIIECNNTHYFASVKRGYWVGYEGKHVLTSYCPAWYCFERQDTEGSGRHIVYPLPGEKSQEKLDKAVCSSNRIGVVCGKCTPNHSVYYHTYSFLCGSDDKCEVGWVFYIVSELLPLTILFLVVIYFDISFTSGAISGFIFFAQVTDSLSINSQGSIWLKPPIYRLTLVYQFIYRSFNFDFFSNEIFSFCLKKGATALDVLAFKYVTVLYAFILIFVLVFIFKYCNLMKHNIRSSVIHGLSAFLIMCYMECIRVSFFLLVPIAIHSKGGKRVHTVVFRNGEIDYFSKAHLPYALPALVCLLTFGIVPPVLLITYPLHYRIIAALRLNEKQWFLKISKYISLERMKPLLDSFQSCFKDNCRFFAGLYFFYRFLLLLLFVFIPSYTMFYATVEIQLIVTLVVHAHVQPYQRKLHNVIDSLVFTNLAIINAITLLNYSITYRRGRYVKAVDTFSSIQLILVFLPLFSLVGYAVYKAILKVKAMTKRDDPKIKEGGDKEGEMEELEMPARLIHEDEMSDSDDGSTDYQHFEDTQTNTSD